MRVIFTFLSGVFLFLTVSHAANNEATLTTGAFVGTPFWNKDVFDEDKNLSSSKYFRLYNRLTVKSRFDKLSLHISGSRSDGFNIENQGLDPDYHLTETKIFRAYAKYKFTGGDIKAGRIQTFSRWLFGSVDGGALSYQFTKSLKASAFGGKGVRYGRLWDDDYDNTVGYFDVAYKKDNLGAKLKYLYSEEASKAGVDLFGRFGSTRVSADIGYDFTNSMLFDAALGVYGIIDNKWSWYGNYSRFSPYNWIFGVTDYGETDYIDRIQAGLTYRLLDDYKLSFKQMYSTRPDYSNYLSYLYLSHKYFTVGLNYLGGDSERFGVSVGGNYSPVDGLRLHAGIASVDYMFADYMDERVTSIASYLRCDWKIIDRLSARGYLNYYHENSVLKEKFRGGLTLQYRYKSGE